MSRNPSDLRPQRNERPGPPGRKPPEPGWRWVVIVVVGLLLATIVLPLFINGHSSKSLTYDAFQGAVNTNQVATATINNSNGQITGKLKDGSSYKVTGPNPAGGTSTALEQNLADPQRRGQLPRPVQQRPPQPAARSSCCWSGWS